MASTTSNKIIYRSENQEFEGLVVRPTKTSVKMPGLLMIHNWMGISEETKKQAERFAELGFIVFAADIYGKGIRPTNPKDAGEQATKFKSNRTLFRQHLALGLEELKKQKSVDSSNLSVAGYCFGGTGAIELARSGADVKHVISFHGGLDSPSPMDAKNIKGHLLILAGADDPYQKSEDLVAFEKEMMDAKVDWQLVKFGGAVHSFTDKGAGNDPSKGAAYNEMADKRSFAMASEFLKTP